MRLLKNLNVRQLIAFLHDLAVSIVAWLLAFLLRFNFSIPPEFVPIMWQTLPLAALIQVVVFWKMGLYQGVWRFASLPDLKRILSAVCLSSLIVAVTFLFQRVLGVVPRSVFILDPMLLMLMMGGSRFAYRAWKEHHLIRFSQLQGEPVLIAGAGDAAIALVKELERSPLWCVVGLLDDNDSLHGLHVHGIPVLGALEQLEELAHERGVRQIIIALPSATHQLRQKVVRAATNAGLSVLTVPSFEDLISGKVNVSSIRKVEVEDLLGREPVALDNAGLRDLIHQRVVMVTGAGGSIGSELCRQIARFSPSLLILFEISEFALYQLEQELVHSFPRLRIVCLVGDVKDSERVQEVLSEYRPNLLFHAAAYKHVPMMENSNAGEALRNNVMGTYVLAKASIKAGVEKFILVSTDKAVNPTNVMGATKRLAEMVCQGLQGSSPTRMLMVRFGNVLGSSGSVIPKFREQIAQGGPVTVTHPEITRFFMSIPEATQLVLQAALMGQGGEIFVLDMGESVRIADLAREMIRLSGFTEEEIKIVYTGLRPGEKLYEELLADDEHTLPTPHPKLRVAQARQVDEAWVADVIKEIRSRGLDEQSVKLKLRAWIMEYQPAGYTEGQFDQRGSPITVH